MPICKNHKTKTYKGTENTPLGKGYHASVYDEGKKMKGKDNTYYKVIKTSNGKKWHKITTRGIQEFIDPAYGMLNIKN